MHYARTLLLTVGGLILTIAASAQTLPFAASYTGEAQIVEILDPTIPIVRFQTTATGTGSFDLNTYASQDIVNLATGAGNGTNRYIADNGDTLLGNFSVQVIPNPAGGLDLLGTATFTGGTGLFSGASGVATLTGSATFTSQTTAVISLAYRGSVILVPEPGGMALLLGIGVSGVALRRRRSRH